MLYESFVYYPESTFGIEGIYELLTNTSKVGVFKCKCL